MPDPNFIKKLNNVYQKKYELEPQPSEENIIDLQYTDETKTEVEYLPEVRSNELTNAQIDNNLVLTSVCTALTAVGKLFYTPLSPSAFSDYFTRFLL